MVSFSCQICTTEMILLYSEDGSYKPRLVHCLSGKWGRKEKQQPGLLYFANTHNDVIEHRPAARTRVSSEASISVRATAKIYWHSGQSSSLIQIEASQFNISGSLQYNMQGHI